jgi:flagellum-specific peptidoglycan hydrolase FlgJ
MKKVMTIFGAVLIASTILTSCGESKSNETTTPTEPASKTEQTKPVEKTTEKTTTEQTTTEQTTEPTAKTEEKSSNSSTDCDQFIKDYEDYVNSYIAAAKKMKANPSDMSVMTEYSEMAAKASTMQTDAKDCTDPKYAAKLAKIAAKLATVAAGM